MRLLTGFRLAVMIAHPDRHRPERSMARRSWRPLKQQADTLLLLLEIHSHCMNISRKERPDRAFPRMGQVARPLAFAWLAGRPCRRMRHAGTRKGHGRTDHEAPVHLAYRIRQDYRPDLGNRGSGVGGSRVTCRTYRQRCMLHCVPGDYTSSRLHVQQ